MIFGPRLRVGQTTQTHYARSDASTFPMAPLISAPTCEPPSLSWNGPAHGYWGWIKNALGLDLPSFELDDDSAKKAFGEGAPKKEKRIIALDGRFDPRASRLPLWFEQFNALRAEGREQLTKGATSKKRSTKSKTSSSATRKEVPLQTTTSTSDPCETDFNDLIGVVLGENWTGHRRTMPLPEFVVPFYWYELYDRILPWSCRSSSGASGCSPLFLEGNRSASPRVLRLLQEACAVSAPESFERREVCLNRWKRSALVVSENQTTASLWEDWLERQGIVSVISHPDSLRFQFQPTLVIIDLDAPPRACSAKVRVTSSEPRKEPTPLPEFWYETVTRVRDAYPDSLLVTLDSFPRWDHWYELTSLGVDVLLPKPFNCHGLLWLFERGS